MMSFSLSLIFCHSHHYCQSEVSPSLPSTFALFSLSIPFHSPGTLSISINFLLSQVRSLKSHDELQFVSVKKKWSIKVKLNKKGTDDGHTHLSSGRIKRTREENSSHRKGSCWGSWTMCEDRIDEQWNVGVFSSETKRRGLTWAEGEVCVFGVMALWEMNKLIEVVGFKNICRGMMKKKMPSCLIGTLFGRSCFFFLWWLWASDFLSRLIMKCTMMSKSMASR